jgi:hypothetical protein
MPAADIHPVNDYFLILMEEDVTGMIIPMT